MEKSIHSPDYAVFLSTLRAAREKAGMTQQQMAAALAATQSAVSKIERGERRLDVVELRAWCQVLGIPLAEFIRGFEQALGTQGRGSSPARR